MAHWEQKDFVKKIKSKLPSYFENQKVLEIGSLDINGTVREFFDSCKYVGLDVAPGKGVDIICEGQKYNAPDSIYDVVCSAECFEHNPYWLETFQNMVRLCKNNGLVFFTCATDGRAEHGTSRTTPADSPLTVGMGWDYYRNLTESDFTSKIDFDSFFSQYEFEVNDQSHDLYFWGIVDKNNSKSLDAIPVIGVPIVNGFHWLERLVNSIDYPVKNLVIINNNGKGELNQQLEDLSQRKFNYIQNIKVCHLPANIGVSGSWNLIIKCYMMEPYWIIANHDVAFTPGLLKEMQEKSGSKEFGVVKANEFQWDLFLINDWVVQECGLFDENFYPAYCEDCDYYLRLLNKNIQIGKTEKSPLHGDQGYETTGSQTWRTDLSLKEKLDYSHNSNLYYIAEKWGDNWRNSNWEYHPYECPYNNSDIPITYTTYDLKFVRRKNMGF